MCFKILDDEDELKEEALEPGDEKELEGVEFFDPPTTFLANCMTSRESCSNESCVSE